MTSEEREEFARILITWVRDEAVRSSDATLLRSKTATGDRWRAAVKRGDPNAAIEVIIPDVVDQTIGRLLIAIDQGVLDVSFQASTGSLVNLTSEADGQLCGWYMASESWRSDYSRERFFDDFAQVEIPGRDEH